MLCVMVLLLIRIDFSTIVISCMKLDRMPITCNCEWKQVNDYVQVNTLSSQNQLWSLYTQSIVCMNRVYIPKDSYHCLYPVHAYNNQSILWENKTNIVGYLLISMCCEHKSWWKACLQAFSIQIAKVYSSENIVLQAVTYLTSILVPNHKKL